jgi:hypothetical protein
MQKVPGGCVFSTGHGGGIEAKAARPIMNRPLSSSGRAAPAAVAAVVLRTDVLAVGGRVWGCWSTTSHGRRHNSGRSSEQAG